MSDPVKAKKNKESMAQLNLLLLKADLKFEDACELAGIKQVDYAFTSFWRGTLKGKGFRMRQDILSALNKHIIKRHQDEIVPV